MTPDPEAVRKAKGKGKGKKDKNKGKGKGKKEEVRRRDHTDDGNDSSDDEEKGKGGNSDGDGGKGKGCAAGYTPAGQPESSPAGQPEPEEKEPLRCATCKEAGTPSTLKFCHEWQGRCWCVCESCWSPDEGSQNTTFEKERKASWRQRSNSAKAALRGIEMMIFLFSVNSKI